MIFFKSLFGKSESKENLNDYEVFWQWFLKHEKGFYKVVKKHEDIHDSFFEKIKPKLNLVKEGIWFLAGMCDEDTAELILTADGDVKSIAFVEELVALAPALKNWKITALKQASDISNNGIEMDGYKFNEDKMSFYSLAHENRPDEIDIVITHQEFNNENEQSITNGVYIALDNYLGELNSLTTIDNLQIINTKDAALDLIPFKKLKSFLIWREKEFLERYDGVRHNSDNDKYASLEATLNNGLPLLAVLNTTLLNWDNKASHQWILKIEIPYLGENNNGLPDDDAYHYLNDIEEDIMLKLIESEGYLNVGRQTADSVREIYIACVDFRKPSKVLYEMQKEYADDYKIDFFLFKDKYWVSLDRFRH